MNPLEPLLGYLYFAIAGYLLSAIVRDAHRWWSKLREKEQLRRATFIREGSKHFYLIEKVTEYRVYVDNQLIGSAEDLKSAQSKGEFELQDLELVDQGLPDTKATGKMIADRFARNRETNP
jgi:hypothetical protein